MQEERMAPKLKLLAAILAVCGFTTASANAQEGEFAGKTITIYIGNTAGGTYDLMARLVARHLGRHLPGHPTIIAENMPGAGTLRAANYVTNVAPKNGTALAIVSETLAVEQALQNAAVQYDAAKLTWIGRVAASNAVHIIWHTSKVQSIEDAKRFEATVAGTGPGNVAEIVPTLLNAVLGTKFKIVRGYPAANESMLAMERGEVEGAAVNWATVKSAKGHWLREKKVKVILQDLPTRGPELQDVPALGELGGNAEAKQLLGLYANTGAIGRSFFAPPGVPPATTKALRDGFIAMSKDPEFVADANKMNAEIEIGTGEEVLKAVEQTLNVPESVLKRAREIFAR
jgi:tripartite-type tricarboxylate transporter receptor subunit TctC